MNAFTHARHGHLHNQYCNRGTTARRLSAELHLRLVKSVDLTICMLSGAQGLTQAAGRAGLSGEKHTGPANELRLGRRRGGRDLSEAEQGFERPHGISA